MRAISDLWSAVNGLFLDMAPAAALIALGVSWAVQKRRLDREEKELRSRISSYKERPAQADIEPPDGGEMSRNGD